MRARLLWNSLLIVWVVCGAISAFAGDTENALYELRKVKLVKAQTLYDQALQKNPTDKKAAFGAAFTRMIQLAVSEPSKKIAAMFGQKEPTLDALVGFKSFLAGVANENMAGLQLTDSLGSVGPWYSIYTPPLKGPVSGGATSSGSSGSECENSYTYEIQHLYAWNGDQSTTIGMHFTSKIIETKSDGTQTIIYQAQPGEVISADKKTNLNCMGWNGSPIAHHHLDVSVGNGKSKWKTYYQKPVSGSITLEELSSGEIWGLQIAINNLGITSWGNPSKTMTINTAQWQDRYRPEAQPGDYFPYWMDWKKILGNAQAGLTVPMVVAELHALIPLVEESAALLQKAASGSQKPAVEFIVPKELFQGVKDITLSRADVVALFGGIKFALAGLYFLDSWNFPITLAGMYSPEGKLLVEKGVLVNELNSSFGLKPDHALDDARESLLYGIRALRTAVNAAQASTNSNTGILDNTEINLYKDLEKLLVNISAAFKGPKDYANKNGPPWVGGSITKSDGTWLGQPVLTLNLQKFFADPPNGDALSSDPFVLETNGTTTQIVLVESFFEELLSGVLNIDLDGATTYTIDLGAVDDGGYSNLFDEFHYLNTGGEISWFPPTTSAGGGAASGSSE